MAVELFPFQKTAVADLRMKVNEAIGSYARTHTPQVVSLQAPTGSGKTIIMASLVEDIFYGNYPYPEQTNAIFVWLSDSPMLNEQSKQKFELQMDKLYGKCITINDESFDMEYLDDGHIYFLNTQKIGKSGNLTNDGDGRQYTIWKTLQNTAREKSDRLYFIIDEAHRGMQGHAAGVATTIMQRFIMGYPVMKMDAMPVVIGVSATADRFNALIGNTTSTLSKCIIHPNEVRSSGLLKDRIVITYPEDKEKYNELAVLGAAVEEWQNKCVHWYQYTSEQHDANVNPVLVVQVEPGHGSKVSDTDLDNVVAKIGEMLGAPLKENEIVHTFGSTGTLTLEGVTVNHIEPTDISDDRRIKVVLFKENLSTGWDCPRAETMISFRVAQDPTYIAQLLGRMVRTPLQRHINVDDYLNDVRLFLPKFDRDNVKAVVDELQATEGGDIPTVLDEDSMDNPTYVSWTVRPSTGRAGNRIPQQSPGQVILLGDDNQQPMQGDTTANSGSTQDTPNNQDAPAVPFQPIIPQQQPTPGLIVPGTSSGAGSITDTPDDVKTQQGEQMTFPGTNIDREEIVRFINDQGFLTYKVKTTRISGSYLKSLLDLASLLTQYGIHLDAADEVKEAVAGLISKYIDGLHERGEYNKLAKDVLSLKLSVQVFDMFGEKINSDNMLNLFTASESDLDRQLRAADAKLGGYGFPYIYANLRDYDDPNQFKVDCILFAADNGCMDALNRYAEKAFHDLNDKYRIYVVNKSEKCKKQYSDIIADGDKVSKHNFSLPETIGGRIDEDGKKYDNHLFVDDKTGYAKIKLNNWEEGVLAEEIQRADFICWIRNPSRAPWALTIPYEMHGDMKPMYPDFIIIRSDPVLKYVIDILEPHGNQFVDNIFKAKGLAEYAEQEPKIGRVQLIHQVGGRFKRLDLSKGEIRDKIKHANNDNDLDNIFAEII